MEFDYREYYYLSQCYENEVDDVILIENIILKYSLDKKFKSKEISIIHKEIKEEYKLFIPTSILEISILKLIKRFPGAFEYKSSVLSMKELPASLIEEFNKLQNEFETNIREIRNAFNEKIDNSHFKITQTEIILLLDKIKEYIIKDKKINDFKNQKELLFFDWVHLVYSENKNQNLIKILNKTIYPLIIYYYFIDYEKPSHKLSEFKIILDTNIVIHLIGINGKTRKEIAIEFLNLIRENGASIIISIETLNEIRDLLKCNPNYDVTFFKQKNQALATQLIENSKAAVESILKSVNVKYSFDNRSKHLNKSKFLEWDSLYSSLMNFKNKIKYKSLTENSIDHDVNLIYISESFKPINNFYDHRSPIASADNKLVQWFSEEMERRFQMKSKSLIPLYKLSLIFWRDGNKNHENEFVSNTWSFICETIPYFRKESSNNIFRIFRENLGSISVPENWKSTYLLVKNNMDEINEDTTEEQALVQSIEKTIRSINHGRNEEFDLLNNQVKELKEQVKNYAEEIEKVKNQNIFFELLNLILRIFGINIKLT